MEENKITLILTCINTTLLAIVFMLALQNKTQRDVDNFHRCVQNTSQADIDICKCAQLNNLNYICDDILGSQQ